MTKPRREGSIALPVKLAVLSHVLPPHDSGQAMILYRLFSDVDPNNYCLLTFSSMEYAHAREATSLPGLPCRHYHLPAAFQLKRHSRHGLRSTRASVNVMLGTVQGARTIASVVRREQCGAILAYSSGTYDLPAAFLASRLLRAQFYAHILDYWQYQFNDPAYQCRLPVIRYLVRYMERIILGRAAGIIVPNEFLRDEYRRRYQVEPILIRNPCDPDAIEGRYDGRWPANEGEIRIVYTGRICEAHHDAFRNLIAAIDRLGRAGVQLHVYTAQTSEELEAAGVRGPVLVHKHLPPPQVYDVQRRADILFLPLAFDSPYPELIRTSATTKIGEYLASGRPVLVHAPADSFISWYAGAHQCGAVVGRSDPALLAQAIQRICDDAGLRQRLSESARARARADFTVASARGQLLGLLRSRASG